MLIVNVMGLVQQFRTRGPLDPLVKEGQSTSSCPPADAIKQKMDLDESGAVNLEELNIGLKKLKLKLTQEEFDSVTDSRKLLNSQGELGPEEFETVMLTQMSNYVHRKIAMAIKNEAQEFNYDVLFAIKSLLLSVDKIHNPIFKSRKHQHRKSKRESLLQLEEDGGDTEQTKGRLSASVERIETFIDNLETKSPSVDPHQPLILRLAEAVEQLQTSMHGQSEMLRTMQKQMMAMATKKGDQQIIPRPRSRDQPANPSTKPSEPPTSPTNKSRAPLTISTTNLRDQLPLLKIRDQPASPTIKSRDPPTSPSAKPRDQPTSSTTDLRHQTTTLKMRHQPASPTGNVRDQPASSTGMTGDESTKQARELSASDCIVVGKYISKVGLRSPQELYGRLVQRRRLRSISVSLPSEGGERVEDSRASRLRSSDMFSEPSSSIMQARAEGVPVLLYDSSHVYLRVLEEGRGVACFSAALAGDPFGSTCPEQIDKAIEKLSKEEGWP
ncbi:hypothetical protein GUITHDRAFT_139449 [Guillardia theta CCMP2712]|uniref:EF-hand domain-containing protein n=1 Tax=Guillardia theta (strain CCMP2712) TaxID=905079 RepID=L1J9Q6_GUITC|nr:hypothetical protein GUITHDRAFT_139449 [Guillardia theta CCMP2712]EKX44824.1 hypothetical protein GUITHDRAFT_139449 [Guillardia theta CCMP2712]|eukprot:XP_005831804.1 hypothetical protein GUITHDRAFT_139449 [Guillardia theta CCMP2712]